MKILFQNPVIQFLTLFFCFVVLLNLKIFVTGLMGPPFSSIDFPIYFLLLCFIGTHIFQALALCILGSYYLEIHSATPSGFYFMYCYICLFLAFVISKKEFSKNNFGVYFYQYLCFNLQYILVYLIFFFKDSNLTLPEYLSNVFPHIFINTVGIIVFIIISQFLIQKLFLGSLFKGLKADDQPKPIF